MTRSVTACALVLALLPIPAASASHRPNAGCSASGDVCVSTEKVNGVRKLRIVLAAKYFNRYELCVTAPDDSKSCKSFQIERLEGGTYGDTVRWSTNFPNKGGGAYSVIWKSLPDGNRVGRKLGFHV